jgi:hypothetical protein
MPHGCIAPLFSDQSDRAASDLEVLLINDHYGQSNCIENKSAQWHFRCVVGAQHLSLLDRQGKYPAAHDVRAAVVGRHSRFRVT